MPMPDFQRSAQTEKLVELLRTASIGQTITYSTLSMAIGEDVQDHRWYLHSATRILEAEGVIFGTELRVGVRRLAAHELPLVGQQAIDRTRRTAKQGSRRLGLIDRMNDVAPEVLSEARGKRSLLNLIAWITGSSQRKRAEELARQTTGPLPPATLLDAWRKP
jgi:hypothetical protein